MNHQGVKISDLLAQSLASLERFPHPPRCQVTFGDSAGLGRIDWEPGALQQAFTLLAQSAARTSVQPELPIQVERFTDDLTGKEWLEISLQSPVRLTPLRQAHIDILVQRVGGRLDLESSSDERSCIYRVYVPCAGVLVRFPAGVAALAR